MDIRAYLDRIGLSSQLIGARPDLPLLTELQRAHLYTVPFENLSIHSGEEVRLERGWLYDKIVARRRGGFCYELNGLFAGLLRELGFQVSMLSARVARAEPAHYGPEFDHLVLRVDLEESWLVDVGFGESYREPLRLASAQAQEQSGGTYRLEPLGEDILYLRRDDTGGWARQYLFNTIPHRHHEFRQMCLHHQTSPESNFTRRWMCSLARPDGRITISQDEMVRTTNGERCESQVADLQQAYAILEQEFGISEVALPEF